MNELIHDVITPYFDRVFKNISSLEKHLTLIDSRISKIETLLQNNTNIDNNNSKYISSANNQLINETTNVKN